MQLELRNEMPLVRDNANRIYCELLQLIQGKWFKGDQKIFEPLSTLKDIIKEEG